MGSGDDQSCSTASELLPLARCEEAFFPVSAQAGGHATAHSSWKLHQQCILSHCYSTVCVSGTSRNISSYTAPKISSGKPWRAKQIKRPADSGLTMMNLIASSLIVHLPAEVNLENRTGMFRLDCLFFVCLFVFVLLFKHRFSVWENMQQQI